MQLKVQNHKCIFKLTKREDKIVTPGKVKLKSTSKQNETGKHDLEKQQGYITQIEHGSFCVQWK